MIIVRSSTVVDVPLELAGQHWADHARTRLHDHDAVPDEWLVKDNACGMLGSGDVVLEPVGAGHGSASCVLRSRPIAEDGLRDLLSDRALSRLDRRFAPRSLVTLPHR
jgi:hypothetical protein